MRDSYTLYQDKLQGEYLEAFKQINLYFSTQQVDDDTQEEYMGDLLDVFLLAQEAGKPIEKITGKNLESFCKAFCSNLTWKQKLLKMLDQLKTMAWFVFFMSALELISSLEDIVSGKESVLELIGEINFFGYILGFSVTIIVSALTDFITQKVMFKIKRVSMIIWEIIVAVLAITSFIVFLMLFFGDSTWDIPVWIVALVSGLYLLLYYALNRNRLKARKEHEVKFWDEVSKDVNTDDIFAEEMEKKWEKKNKKLLKQGKPAMTREEIILVEEAECLKVEDFKIWRYFIPLIILMILCVVFCVWLEMSFKELADMLWFLGILAVVEYVLMILLRKAAHSGLVNRRKWIETERKKLNQINNTGNEEEV